MNCFNIISLILTFNEPRDAHETAAELRLHFIVWTPPGVHLRNDASVPLAVKIRDAPKNLSTTIESEFAH